MEMDAFRLSLRFLLDVDDLEEMENVINFLGLIHWLRLMKDNNISVLSSLHPHAIEILFCALVNFKGVKGSKHITRLVITAACTCDEALILAALSNRTACAPNKETTI